MEKYKCDICGKKHNVFRSIESPLPELISDIPEEERENRIYDMKGIYIIDKEKLLGNGFILIEMENLDEPIFYWQVWVQISIKGFQDNLEQLKNGDRVELKGKLLSQIPFYSKSNGLKSKVIIQASNEIEIEVRIDEDSQLKEDQSKPISEKRVIEIMQRLNHYELFKEIKKFDKPFSQRLMDELNFAEKEYIKTEKGFVININSPNTTLFQIVNSNMLESKVGDKKGFGLHLSFDDSFDESIEEISKFRNQYYFNNFNYHYLDEIPTYQIELEMDKEQIKKLVIQIIQNVYEKNLETVEIDNFEI